MGVCPDARGIVSILWKMELYMVSLLVCSDREMSKGELQLCTYMWQEESSAGVEAVVL